MKAGNIRLIIGAVCSSIILNMINFLFANDNEETSLTVERLRWTDSYTNPGYKPVRDECPYLEDAGGLKDNFLYKEWCEKKFNNGTDIYEGYKDIAFNIKYEPETDRSDVWQTPTETIRSGKGDCEDAVFLFFSHLDPNQVNAEIVWGWVIDNHTGLARAHVWYQLRDNEDCQYVVEGFSNEWNGIIPMEIIERTEIRKPILIITHFEAVRLTGLIHRSDSMKLFQMLADLHGPGDLVNYETGNKNFYKDVYARHYLDPEYIENHRLSREFKMSWKLTRKQRFQTAMSKEISKIYNKLHELFTRYQRQMKRINANSYITDRRYNLNPDGNLICRR